MVLALPMQAHESILAGDLIFLGQLLPELRARSPAVPALSHKRKCFQFSPLTQTFKSKHSKATGRVGINKM